MRYVYASRVYSGEPVSTPVYSSRARPGGTLLQPRRLSSIVIVQRPSPPDELSGRSSMGRPLMACTVSPPTRPRMWGGGGSTLSSIDAYETPDDVSARTVYHVVTLLVEAVGEPTSAGSGCETIERPAGSGG